MPNQKISEDDERPDEELTERELELREYGRQKLYDDEDGLYLDQGSDAIDYYYCKKTIMGKQREEVRLGLGSFIDSLEGVSPNVKQYLKNKIRIKIYFED